MIGEVIYAFQQIAKTRNERLIANFGRGSSE